MTHIITDRCVGVKDGSCITVCPVDCIHGGPDDPQFYIDPEVCIDCAACTSVCPVNAIYEETDLPKEYEHFLHVNADYFSVKSE